VAQELGRLLLIGDVDACEGEQRVDEDDVGLLVDDELTEGGGEGRAGADCVAEDGEVFAEGGLLVAVEVGACDDILKGLGDVARVILSLEHDGAKGLGWLDAEEVTA